MWRRKATCTFLELNIWRWEHETTFALLEQDIEIGTSIYTVLVQDIEIGTLIHTALSKLPASNRLTRVLDSAGRVKSKTCRRQMAQCDQRKA